VFKTAADRLYATFQTTCPMMLDARGASQPHAAKVALGLWNSRLAAKALQYRDMFSQQGRYTCVTFQIDLSNTCDPLSSLWSAGKGCVCHPGKRCSAKSMAAAQTLFLAPAISLSNISIGASCGSSVPDVTLGAYKGSPDGVVVYSPRQCSALGAALSRAAAVISPPQHAPVAIEVSSGRAPFTARSCGFLTDLLAVAADKRRFSTPPKCSTDGKSLTVTFQMASHLDATAVVEKIKAGRESLSSAMALARCSGRITISSKEIVTFDGSNTAALACTQAPLPPGAQQAAAGQQAGVPRMRVSVARGTADFSQSDCLALVKLVVPAAAGQGYTNLACTASGKILTALASFETTLQAQAAAALMAHAQGGERLRQLVEDLRVCNGSVVVAFGGGGSAAEQKVGSLSKGSCR
jgi:hypothetical protein